MITISKITRGEPFNYGSQRGLRSYHVRFSDESMSTVGPGTIGNAASDADVRRYYANILAEKNAEARAMRNPRGAQYATVRVSTTRPSTMTAAAINKEMDKLEVQRSENTRAFIAAGRGHERYSDTAGKKDPLSVASHAIQDRYVELYNEIEQRYGPRGTPSRLPLRGYGPRENPASGPRAASSTTRHTAAVRSIRAMNNAVGLANANVAAEWYAHEKLGMDADALALLGSKRTKWVFSAAREALANRKNPRVTKKALRAAHAVGAAAANARMRAEEAAEAHALGASTFTWRGSTAHGEARGTRFLQCVDDARLQPYLRQKGNTVTLTMPPNADPNAKYAAHSAFGLMGEYFPDAWKMRNKFDAWVQATPEGWED